MKRKTCTKLLAIFRSRSVNFTFRFLQAFLFRLQTQPLLCIDSPFTLKPGIDHVSHKVTVFILFKPPAMTFFFSFALTNKCLSSQSDYIIHRESKTMLKWRDWWHQFGIKSNLKIKMSYTWLNSNKKLLIRHDTPFRK